MRPLGPPTLHCCVETLEDWSCGENGPAKLGGVGMSPGPESRAIKGCLQGVGPDASGHRTALDGTEESPLYASGKYRRPQGHFW